MEIIKKLKRAKYYEDPFEHLIIDNFFTDEELLKIEREFPSSNKIFTTTRNFNKKLLRICLQDAETLHYLAKHKKLRSDEALLKSLQKIAESNYTQNTNYTIQSNAAENYILPTIQQFMSAWHDFRGNAMPFIQSFKSFKNLDTNSYQAIANRLILRSDIRAISPANRDGTTSLGPHLDASGELLAGLIYLKHKNDHGQGGSLELYKLKDTAPKQFMSSKRRIPMKYIERRKVISYKRNIAVIFPNTFKSIHGISPRDAGIFDRRVINFSIELDGAEIMDYSKFFDKRLDESAKYSSYEYIDSTSL